VYRYDEFDRRFLDERVKQYRDQVRRRLAGQLTEDEFRPLRLRNGLYLQLHAYMLRIAIPYGMLSPEKLRMLAHVARRYDRGYGHFTTRQNIQFNWIKLEETPDILADLAMVELHGIQTSGNCIRNVTGARSSANGRRSIPSSRSCRASSRSPSRRQRPTAPRCASTTSASISAATTPAKSASRCWWAAVWDARR
jgi:sulfite reductase (NADPH) hemoprotein beta-component